MEISIIIPIVRKSAAATCIKAIKRNSGTVPYEIVSAVDTDGIGCPKMVEMLTARTKNDWVMFLGDDTVPEPGFLEAARLAALEIKDGWGVVGINTQDPNGANDRAHWMAHKKILPFMGGAFFPTEYKHCFGDDELKDVAQELGQWVFAKGCKIKHNHPVNKTAPYDEFHKKAYNDGAFEHDQKVYYRRRIQRLKRNGIRNVGIAWPITDEKIHSNFVVSFLAIDKPDYDFFVPRWRGNIDSVRNDLVKQALEVGVTHLWFTDTDQIYFNRDTLTKLLSHNKPIAAAPVFRRYEPFDPIFMRHEGDEVKHVEYEEVAACMKTGKTVEINATGMGCVLFDMEVFLNIEDPWFKLPDYGQPGPGEDIYFWHKANQAGYKILVDCSITVKHLTTMGVGWGTHQVFRQLKKMEGKEL